MGLLAILYHPEGLELFTNFCKSEFSTENITFWRKARKFYLMSASSIDGRERASLLEKMERRLTVGELKFLAADLLSFYSTGGSKTVTCAHVDACLAAMARLTDEVAPVTAAALGLSDVDDSDDMPGHLIDRLMLNQSHAAVALCLKVLEVSDAATTRKVFNQWDLDGSGAIDFHEFCSAARAMHTSADDDGITRHFNQLSGGGTDISLAGFFEFNTLFKLNSVLLQRRQQVQVLPARLRTAASATAVRLPVLLCLNSGQDYMECTRVP